MNVDIYLHIYYLSYPITSALMIVLHVECFKYGLFTEYYRVNFPSQVIEISKFPIHNSFSYRFIILLYSFS